MKDLYSFAKIQAPTGDDTFLAKGKSAVIDIPKSKFLAGLHFMVKLNSGVCDDGSDGNPVPGPEAPASLLENIHVWADGYEWLIDGATLMAVAKFYRKQDPDSYIETVEQDSPVSLGYADIELMFNALGMYPARVCGLLPTPPKDSKGQYLGHKFETVQLQFDFNPDNLIGASGTVYSITDATVEIVAIHDSAALEDGIIRPGIRKLVQGSKDVTASGELDVNLNVNCFHQFTLIKCEHVGVPEDGIITDLAIYENENTPILGKISMAAYNANLKKALGRVAALPTGYLLIDWTNLTGSYVGQNGLKNAYGKTALYVKLFVSLPNTGAVKVKTVQATIDRIPTVL